MAIRTLHVGLGPIGLAVAQQVAKRAGFRIAGAVDIDPQKVGRDMGEVLGREQKLRVKVESELAVALEKSRADVAVICTSSSLEKTAPTFQDVLQSGLPVVSTTEELAYPVGDNRKIARRLDAVAQQAGVALLGTGINPGLAMDVLPIILSSPCAQVNRIEVHRVQDARARRLPFQQKIGAGLSVEEFQAKVEQGGVRHVGLAESVSMIADSLAWKLSNITDEIEPKVAAHTVASPFLQVHAGQVCGLLQEGKGFVDNEAVITLRMEAYLGAPKSYEWIRIDGDPPLEMTIPGGLPGDVATASMVVNAIPKVLSLPPGLRTMRDFLPSYFSGTSRHWSNS